jgi:hypothetical protein
MPKMKLRQYDAALLGSLRELSLACCSSASLAAGSLGHDDALAARIKLRT